MPLYEPAVRFFANRCEIQERSALIKRPRGREKNVLHHVALAAREYEGRIRASLNVGTQNGLYVLFRITGDLLELVDIRYLNFNYCKYNNSILDNS